MLVDPSSWRSPKLTSFFTPMLRRQEKLKSRSSLSPSPLHCLRSQVEQRRKCPPRGDTFRRCGGAESRTVGDLWNLLCVRKLANLVESALTGDSTLLALLNPKKKIFETVQPGFTTLENKDAAWVDKESGKVHKIVTSKGLCAAGTYVGAGLS